MALLHSQCDLSDLSLSHPLSKDQPQPVRWAVGFLVSIQGSSYRKPGAMMLFNDLGQHFGLLSGGCLEQHLCQQAIKAISQNQCSLLNYELDSPETEAETEEPIDNSASKQNSSAPNTWQLAIGCGGSVTIFIVPIRATNNFLSLAKVHSAIQQKQTCELTLVVKHQLDPDKVFATVKHSTGDRRSIRSQADYDGQQEQLTIRFNPPIHLLICGAGVDAIPLANIATEMGWQVSINETRSQYQKPGRFPATVQTKKISYDNSTEQNVFISADCIIIMHHNLTLDAEALKAASHSHAQYIGVLGPYSRLEKLLRQAGLNQEHFNGRLHGPCGLALGGDNPASVALSIISHCHAILADASMQSLPID